MVPSSLFAQITEQLNALFSAPHRSAQIVMDESAVFMYLQPNVQLWIDVWDSHDGGKALQIKVNLDPYQDDFHVADAAYLRPGQTLVPKEFLEEHGPLFPLPASDPSETHQAVKQVLQDLVTAMRRCFLPTWYDFRGRGEMCRSCPMEAACLLEPAQFKPGIGCVLCHNPFKKGMAGNTVVEPATSVLCMNCFQDV